MFLTDKPNKLMILDTLYSKTIGLEDVCWAMRGRQTSRAEDEALYIATLLDLNAEALALIDDHEARVQAMWRQLGEKDGIQIPKDIVFDCFTPKLSTRGSRWPQYSLREQGPLFELVRHFGAGGGRVRNDGLLVNFPGYVGVLMPPCLNPMHNSKYPSNRLGRPCRLLRIRLPTGQWAFMMGLVESHNARIYGYLNERREDQFAVILKSLERNPEGVSSGILGKVESNSQGTYFVENRGAIYLRYFVNEHNAFCDRVLEAARQLMLTKTEVISRFKSSAARSPREYEQLRSTVGEAAEDCVRNFNFDSEVWGCIYRGYLPLHSGSISSTDTISLVTCEIYDVFLGLYQVLDDTLPEGQSWCVD
ncbi:MAG: hypothetical protein M1831_006126 [Alyxoria varia]|nr:MAG: hypothetical protein M1831_006126 [Alyxoria varia]